MKMLKNMVIVALVSYGASAMAMESQTENLNAGLQRASQNVHQKSEFMKQRIAQFGGSVTATMKRLPIVLRGLNPKTAAVLIIDIQDDFTHPNSYKFDKAKDGALAVPNSGDDYVAAAIAMTKIFKNLGYKIYASQDDHPMGHMSFASSHPGKNPFEMIEIEIPTQSGEKKMITQMLWPDHCVQGTHGADILIPRNLIDVVVPKGMNKDCDSYSAFQDDGGQDTGLNNKLNAAGIQTVIIYGIATDYCVKASALHAIQNGKKVYLITDLCRGVDAAGSQKAIEEMRQAGVVIVDSKGF